MKRKFVLCNDCIYNLTTNSKEVVCNVMILEEPVIIKNKRGKTKGCRYGCNTNDVFPEE